MVEYTLHDVIDAKAGTVTAAKSRHTTKAETEKGLRRALNRVLRGGLMKGPTNAARVGTGDEARWYFLGASQKWSGGMLSLSTKVMRHRGKPLTIVEDGEVSDG